MILFCWIVYLLGIVATMLLLYHGLGHGMKITVGDITLAFLIGIFSWLGFIIAFITLFADHEVFTKK